MAAAYRAMSPGLQKMLCGLSAWHSDSSFLDSNVALENNPDAFRDPVLHPVIINIWLLVSHVFMLMEILQIISRIGVSTRAHPC